MRTPTVIRTSWPRPSGVLREAKCPPWRSSETRAEGRLSPAIHYPGYVSFGARAAGDFDDDGDLDFIVASAIDPPRLTLLPNTGRGEFPAAVELDSPGKLHGMVAVDYDADGDLDLG